MSLSQMPKRRAPRIGVTGVVDASGKPITVLPDHIDALFMRRVYRRTKGILKVDAEGGIIRSDAQLVRAQIPYLVTLLVYGSRFQMNPTEQEWILYAPGDLKSAATVALQMWKRWFKPDRKPGEAPSGLLLQNDFPLIGDGVIVEPIDDKFFDECWNYIRKRKHKCAGHPERPWLFTCSDSNDFAVYKHTDRQAGLRYRL